LLDPKTDFIFKNIFGKEESKPLLISFLNALLKCDPPIKTLELKNTDIAKALEDNKESRLDVRATTDNKTEIDIEIQFKNTGEIAERAFHYIALMKPRVVKTNESYKGTPVIAIWILAENVTDRISAINEAYMTFQANDSDPYQIMTKTARVIFVELEKFNPRKADSRDLLTAWLSFLKDPVFMDTSFLKVPEVNGAMDTLKYISADEEVRAIADLRMKTLNDRNSEMTVAKEEGRMEGRQEGEQKKAREAACNLLSKGMNLSDIAEVTGLSEQEIISLKR
jgi:predicted transposase/invertase (TIGR01784 family)